MAPELTLVLGGVRSGKSAFAEGLARQSDGPVLYLATGQVTDDEMAERIRRHREARPGHWGTLEEPLALAEALRPVIDGPNPPGMVLLDSLDVWVSNLLLQHEGEPFVDVESLTLEALGRLLDLCRDSPAGSIMVSSEVGLSLVPPTPLGRHFQDLLGLANQQVAAAATRVYLVVAGQPLAIK
ncbi:MAG: bifunctional adenosylcobinamide kinase/adenosylcobinamide-phosphate guanylyltransferase [Alphaproteobacteria bacterium]|nr:bifunctional adenosylcobinamide kinase/adenosylcobinamide-phosphate guanylyltransferase [Alphaproteobacteria bacterium]